MSSWNLVEISSFLKERKNKMKPEEANNSGLKRIEKIDFNGNIFINHNKLTNTDMIVVKKGDLVISGINVEKGALAVYEGEKDVVATIHYSAYEFDNSKINIDYLKWFLKSKVFLNILKEQAGGGIKTELKPKKFLPLKINLPDMDLQRRIVKNIEEVSIEIRDIVFLIIENSNYLNKLKETILKDAIQGKLVPQNPDDEPASELLKRIKEEKQKLIAEGRTKKEKPLPPISNDEIPFELPKGWEWVRLGELLYSTDAGKSPDCVGNSVVGNKWGVIKTTAIQQNFFLEDENKVLPSGFIVSDSHKININDVLITRAGPKNRVGIVCCVEKIDKNLILSDKTIRIRLSDSLINHKYISFALNSSPIRPFIEQKMTGMAESQVNISQINMRWFPVPIPPLLEQQRIVKKIDQIISYCDKLEKSVSDSKKDSEMLTQSVLQEAFK